MSTGNVRLKNARVLAGIKQRDLAAAIQRSQTWLSFVESGRIAPDSEMRRKIAEALGQEVGFLFTEDGDIDDD